ncbi:MAG TPA: hypothetical protein VF384_13565 [Planctomycetota bacterium]
MKTRQLALLASLALLAAAPAQQKADPFRFVPADAQVVVRIAAPARWQQQFAETKIAKLLAGEAFAPWIARLQEALDDALASAGAKGAIDADHVKRFVKDYRGDIVFALLFDPEELAASMNADDPPAFTVVHVLTADPGFDLASMGATIAKAAEEQGEPMRDLVVGEHRLRAVDLDDGIAATAPFLIDGHLVTLVGKGLDDNAARVLAAGGRMQPAGGEASFWAHVELRPLMQALQQVLAAESADASDKVDRVLLDSGLMAVESATMSIAASGHQTLIEGSLAIGAENRGLFDAFPRSQDAVELLRWLPPDADAFAAFPLDVGVLYDVVAKGWKSMGEDVPIRFDDAIAKVTEFLRVRIKEDLIDHLGVGMLQLQDVDDAMDFDSMMEAIEDNPLGASSNSCYVIALRDGRAFAASLETALRARGLHAARKSEDYQSTKIHRLRIAGIVELEYAITDSLLLVAAGHGESPGKLLRGVLDTAAAGGTAELPKECAATIAALPKGWVGVGATPLARTLSGLGSMIKWLEAMGGSLTDSEADTFLKMLGDLAPEIERFGLGTLVQGTWVEPRRLTMRMVW